MRYDVLTSGYVSMDRIIKVKTPLKTGYTSIIANKDNTQIHYGGCSINIAYLLAKLGLKTLPIVRFGGDYRENGFYEFLADGGVCLDAVEIVEEDATSNCCLIADPDNNHITLFYPGAMDQKYARPMKDEFFENARVGVLTVGSYKDNIEFFNQCRKHRVPLVFGMRCDFDAFPVDFFREVLMESSIIFTNEIERKAIEKLFGFESITDIFQSGKAEIIVTTLGKRGSVFYRKTENAIETGMVKAAEFGKVVDTTGSGDAYIAGFLYGYLKGKETLECCSMGSVLSSFVIEKAGCLTNAPDEKAFLTRYQQFASEGVN